MSAHSMTSPIDPEAHRRFTRIVLVAAFLTFMMITLGAITRVTESGMGCGTYWPDCNGRLIPEFRTTEEIIEMVHRLFALLVGVYTLWVGLRAWQRYRQRPGIFLPAMLAVVLFFVQSGLGAVTVRLSNHWVSVLLHLGNAMFLLAAFLVAWTVARFGDDLARWRSSIALRLPPAEVIMTTGLVLCVAMIGAAVAGNEATKACIGWPLCDGELLPTRQGPLQMLNMTHRLIVGGMGVLLVIMLWQLRGSRNPLMTRGLQIAIALYLAQCALGALVVLVNQREWLTAFRALHVTFAAATWSAMIVLSTVSWLQHSPVPATAKPTLAASATTSS